MKRISLYQLRQLINAYDKEEISLSRFCEILNCEGQPNHINDYGKKGRADDLAEAITIIDLIVNDDSLKVYDAVDNDFKEKRELGLSFLNKFNKKP